MLSEEGYLQRLWGPLGALREILEGRDLPAGFYGTSVSDNVLEQLQRALFLALLVKEHAQELQSVAAEDPELAPELARDLENLAGGLHSIGSRFADEAVGVGRLASSLCSTDRAVPPGTDMYGNWKELSAKEREGRDFRVQQRIRRTPAIVVVAPHGGGIERGTSEVARAVAGEEYSFYAFEGRKPRGNRVLHITSTRFDEPRLAELVAHASLVVTVHGEGSPRQTAFVGGADRQVGDRLIRRLKEAGFSAGRHEDPGLAGEDSRNICNRGSSGQGVQLELAMGLRRSFFASLDARGRREPTDRFEQFVAVVRGVLAEERGRE